MAQLRQDYQKFVDKDIEILVVGPEGPQEFKEYWENKKLPFIGLPDPDYNIIKLYGQEVKLLKLGRMPAQIVIDRKGIVIYAHYGQSMSDIPLNEEILQLF